MGNYSEYFTQVVEFKKKIKNWRENHTDLEFIFNEELLKFHSIFNSSIIENLDSTQGNGSDHTIESLFGTINHNEVSALNIKYIVIGDNPGSYEAEDGVYFSPRGASGRKFRNIFNKARMKNTLIFNKTPIHTNVTGGLGKLDQNTVKLTCKYMAELIYTCHKKDPLVKVLIIGTGGATNSGNIWLKDNGEEYAGIKTKGFFKTLISCYKKHEDSEEITKEDLINNIHVLPHCSPLNSDTEFWDTKYSDDDLENFYEGMYYRSFTNKLRKVMKEEI